MRFRISVSFLVLLGLISVVTALWASTEPNSSWILLSPQWNHWLGTDSMGRDLFLRLMSATRVSLTLGVVSSFLSCALGIAVSFVALLSPAWLDRMIMRSVEVCLALPSIVLISVFVLFFKNVFSDETLIDQILILGFAIVLTSWMPMARQMRTWLGLEYHQGFIEAARALGASPWRILYRHLFPQTWNLLLVFVGLQIPNFLLFESFLSFVGLGIQSPHASWGILIQESWQTLSTYPYLLIGPSGLLFLTVFSINIVFSELQKMSSPKTKHLKITSQAIDRI